MAGHPTFTGAPARAREEWLQRAADLVGREFDEIFEARGNGLSKLRTPRIRVSCAFPVRTRGGSHGHAIGQCWHGSVSADGTFEIFVSPEIDEPSRAADILIHELIHAIDGLESGHKGRFKEIALAVGLEGPMTATRASEDLGWWLSFLTDRIGPYPHAAMNVFGRGRGERPRKPGQPPITDGPPKQGTRMLKAECPKCGCIIRLTRSAAQRAGGLPTCACGGHFRGEGFE